MQRTIESCYTMTQCMLAIFYGFVRLKASKNFNFLYPRTYSHYYAAMQVMIAANVELSI